MAMTLLLWVLTGVAAIILLYIAIGFNSLITARNRVENAWSQIDVQLKRRFDLIPNLVEAVKGYMKYEQKTFKMITEARSLMTKAGSVKEKAKAENMLAGALKTIFAVAENYPRLKANKSFLMLQEELSGTESKIAYSRQFYNDSVMSLNNKIQYFPTNILAGIFGFKEQEYFEAEKGAEKPVKVKF